MREVQYMTDLAGNRVAVQPAAPKVGFEFGGIVYGTREEAVAAEGRHRQAVYFDKQYEVATNALEQIFWSISPPKTYYGDDQDEQREKNEEIVRDLMRDLFPMYGKRSAWVDEFLQALDQITRLYEEMPR